ncbi:MAG: hypothetical protein LBD97_09070 [Bifidobacteriaceae bacterium]|jgi:hypothetical protein|nr:hypothetical protein [Bifidobacteriaceae bacterium]
MFRTKARKTLASIATAATAAAALVVIAQPAAAADGDPLQLGYLLVSPSSGKIDLGTGTGWLEAAWGLEGQVCPAGFTSRTGLYDVVDGVLGNSSVAYVLRAGFDYKPSYGGINDGETFIRREGNYVGSTTNSFPWVYPLSDGLDHAIELRHTCQAAAAYAPATDPYYSIRISLKGDGSWQAEAVSTPPTAIDDSESDINVVVPQAQTPPEPPTGLKISVKPGATTLTGPTTRVAGQVWTATGNLDDVTVEDDRQDAAAAGWTLNGKASAFTKSGGLTPIAATNLGWAPAKVSGAGTAGAAVAVGVGLATDRPLATGTASATPKVTTTVNAVLTLDVPAAAEDGSYKSTLTLTLI